MLPANSQALYLLQRLRDEAHRFAITYHRKLRAKAQTKSVLDDLPGVGPARKRALLRVFGSTRQMRSATIDEIAVRAGHQPLARRKDPRRPERLSRIRPAQLARSAAGFRFAC